MPRKTMFMEIEFAPGRGTKRGFLDSDYKKPDAHDIGFHKVHDYLCFLEHDWATDGMELSMDGHMVRVQFEPTTLTFEQIKEDMKQGLEKIVREANIGKYKVKLRDVTHEKDALRFQDDVEQRREWMKNAHERDPEKIEQREYEAWVEEQERIRQKEREATQARKKAEALRKEIANLRAKERPDPIPESETPIPERMSAKVQELQTRLKMAIDAQKIAEKRIEELEQGPELPGSPQPERKSCLGCCGSSRGSPRRRLLGSDSHSILGTLAFSSLVLIGGFILYKGSQFQRSLWSTTAKESNDLEMDLDEDSV